MGLRYRKSINLGGGFRINLSKSGIGYSWGFPGYRHTYSANGSQRKTYSIPGTGIFYVEEKGKRKNNSSNQNIKYDENTKLITGDVQYYQNENISSMGKGDELLNQINTLRSIDIIANICLFSVIALPIGIILKILIAKKWKIDLTYEMDDLNTKKFESLNNFLIEISKNKKIWQIDSSVNVYNSKYNAGAGSNVTRHSVSIHKKMPWYISHNIDVYCLSLTKEKIYFTPDRMLIFKNFGGVGVRSYNDMSAGFSWTNFVETEFVPRDAEIVDYTWTYVNKNGGPDKRFSNNRQIPVCRYGKVTLQSEDGINILLHISNHRTTPNVEDRFIEFMDCHNKIILMEHENKINKDNKSKNENDKWNNYNNNENNQPSEDNKHVELDDCDDTLYNEIVNFVIQKENISISLLQREFKLGYNRAARIMELLEERGIVGPQNESKPREVLVNNNKENQTHAEQIYDPVIIQQQNKNLPTEQKKSSKLSKVLCYIQVFFSFMIVIGCIEDKMIGAGICWTLIGLIFIPKIKEIIIQKKPEMESWIIPIRIILILIGFWLIGITAPTT